MFQLYQIYINPKFGSVLWGGGGWGGRAYTSHKSQAQGRPLGPTLALITTKDPKYKILLILAKENIFQNIFSLATNSSTHLIVKIQLICLNRSIPFPFFFFFLPLHILFFSLSLGLFFGQNSVHNYLATIIPDSQ